MSAFPSRIAFLASSSPPAQQALAVLTERYGHASPDQADVICALGGDGFMLHTLHDLHNNGSREPDTPVYGMCLGTVGFLLNEYRIDGLRERIAQAEPTVLRPLEMTAITRSGEKVQARAYNEVALLRETRQTAHLRVTLNGKARLEELVCDGVIVATPAGSTAYNFSAHGPILPLDSRVIALTPIAAFRPRRWRGAILPDDTEVELGILDPSKRPVSATADSFEVREVVQLTVRASVEHAVTLLFDPEHNLDERILSEQFLT
ncbi:MAG: NAD kinase [Xanthomonadaceae bacterium]|nr:NAD kinase [Xanthomonadaceae bacterium]